MTIVQKIAINIFIMVSIWVMVGANMRLEPIQIFPEWFPASHSRHPVARLNWYIQYADWIVIKTGWLVGIRTAWLMFSRIDMNNWYMHIVGIDAEDREIPLPLRTETKRSFFERNVIDFREYKIHHNLYGSAPGRTLFVEHICRYYRNRGLALSGIRLDLSYYRFHSIEEAGRFGERIAREPVRTTFGTYGCAHNTDE